MASIKTPPESLKGGMILARALRLHRIETGCAVGNIGSIRVLEKAGMVREGRLRQVLPLRSGWSDNFKYSILETDERKNN